MLIADTGPLVAMLNAKDKHYEACTALFRRFRGPIIVPAPIVTEVAYFLQIETGARGAVAGNVRLRRCGWTWAFPQAAMVAGRHGASQVPLRGDGAICHHLPAYHPR